MTTNRRKKNSRMRGSGSQGWGSKKSHRGSGRKGGAGYSGTGKRADQMKPSIWKDLDFFGKHGFFPHGSPKTLPPVNIKYIEERLEQLVADKKAEKIGDKYNINLTKLGFGKLLSQGNPTHKLVITCTQASGDASEKIKRAGGEILMPGASLAKMLKAGQQHPQQKKEKKEEGAEQEEPEKESEDSEE
ncbi:50S ribosomal protein L15 [Candidatus Woesearchaeota archaeon CG07_land_8_20_14_0_80_44_23]|nr:MAG: 50S ribosomal protein L15 [Candidatus Woesearchaeota archaeon CG07_land_8_20_14_0_80_44_23]